MVAALAVGGTLALAFQILLMLPDAIRAGGQIAEAALDLRRTVMKLISENRDPTDEEWDEINRKMQSVHVRIQDKRTDLVFAPVKIADG